MMGMSERKRMALVLMHQNEETRRAAAIGGAHQRQRFERRHRAIPTSLDNVAYGSCSRSCEKSTRIHVYIGDDPPIVSYYGSFE